MSFTQRTAAALLNSLLSNTSDFGALASAPSIHVGLSTSTPAEDGTNVTEPVGNNYARVAVPGPANWDAATDADPSVADNTNVITFPTPSGSWGTVTHFVIFDALTLGNVIASGALTTSRAINNGDSVNFQAGELDITLD
jgi:hypothetical protein